jgi:hypothetical protein
VLVLILQLCLALAAQVAAVQISALPELSQLYKAEKGQVEVKGKLMTVETIPGGHYSYTYADGRKVYAESVTIRNFMQRFQLYSL